MKDKILTLSEYNIFKEHVADIERKSLNENHPITRKKLVALHEKLAFFAKQFFDWCDNNEFK